MARRSETEKGRSKKDEEHLTLWLAGCAYRARPIPMLRQQIRAVRRALINAIGIVLVTHLYTLLFFFSSSLRVFQFLRFPLPFFSFSIFPFDVAFRHVPGFGLFCYLRSFFSSKLLTSIPSLLPANVRDCCFDATVCFREFLGSRFFLHRLVSLLVPLLFNTFLCFFSLFFPRFHRPNNQSSLRSSGARRVRVGGRTSTYSRPFTRVRKTDAFVTRLKRTHTHKHAERRTFRGERRREGWVAEMGE